MALLQSRREFAATLSLAGAAALIGGRAALADEGPPETTRCAAQGARHLHRTTVRR